MSPALVASGIFGIPVLLLTLGFRITGRRVEWKPLIWAGISFAIYLLLLRSRGFLPEPPLIEALELNWYGKSLSLLGTCLMLAFLPGVGFRAAGFRWRQERGSLRPVLVAGCVTIVSATVAAGLFSTTRNTSAEWLAFQAVMPGLDEELYMRGLLLLLFHRAFGKGLRVGNAETGWGLWLTTLLFGLLHGLTVQDGAISANLAVIALTGFVGFIAGWMRERTGSLVAPVLFHNSFNVAQSFV